MRFSLKRGNIAYLFISALVYFGAVFIIPTMLPMNLNVDIRFNIVLGLSLLATIFMLVYSLKSKNDIDRGEKPYNLLIIIAIGLAGFLCMMFLQGFINVMLQYLSNFFDIQTNSQNTSNVVEIINHKPVFVFYVVIFGPVMEELFFRKALFGYLYDAMLGTKEWIRFFVSALITGIAFAIPHDGFSPIMVVYIVMSLVFSFLYLKTKNILTPMIAHITMNGLVVVIQVLLKAYNLN